MKPVLLIGLLLALLGGGTYWLSFHGNCDKELHEAAHKGDTLAWMKCEFKLSAEQEARIRALHRDYSEACEKHCAKIKDLQLRIQNLKNQADKAAREKAERELQALKHECDGSVDTLLNKVASILGPEEAVRYLGMTRPLIRSCLHQEAPSCCGEKPSCTQAP